MSDDRDREVFVAALNALGDHLPSVVLVGGWAHRLHHEIDGAVPSDAPLYTQDLDFAVRRPPPAAEPPLDERLVAAGFRERLKGEGQGVTEYVWEGGGSALTVEFLVHRRGAERTTGLDVGGARAQPLRYLDLAFVSPCEIVISAERGFPIDGELRLSVANPAAFLMNKLLTYDRRTELVDKGKDLLYIYDTLRLFATSTEVVQGFWNTTWSTQSRAVARRMRSALRQLADQALVADEASRIAAAAGRSVPADRLLRTCCDGLEQLIASASS